MFHLPMLLMTLANALLFPYSMFVYESVMSFIMGHNEFFVNVVLMLAVKVVTMTFCWMLAIFISPFGLVFLYYDHRKVLR